MAAPMPVLSELGERLRERTAPLAPTDAENGWVHARLCEAIMVMLAEVAQVYDPPDPHPPGAPLLDPTLAPDWALPWVGQLVGVHVPPGLTPDQARTLITDVAGWSRGTPESLRAAAGVFLTDTKTVYFRERDGDPYALEVVTLASETPDPAATLDALLAQKPGGIVLTFRQVTGWDYQQMTTEGGPYSALPATFSDYYELSNNERSA